MNVIVIGGGIVGLASAYYLADRGADVTVYEKGSLGMGSTSRSAGGIRSQFSTAVNVELSLASKQVWDTFETDFGVDIGRRKNGYLFLARSADVAEQFRHNVRMQRDLGADSEFLTPEEATEHCPGLRAEQFVAATYNGDDGIADPNLAVQGYAASARELGVDVRTNTAVTGVLWAETEANGDEARGRIAGVEAEGETNEADFVVNAAGAWAARVADMADIDLPIAPRRRQIAVVDPTPPVAESVPLTIDLETGSYFRPERDGIALVGGHFGDDEDADPDRYSEDTDLDWTATAVERAADYTDYFGDETRVVRGWAGLYAVTPDNHPIVEETVPGLITAAGFSGHGFQHAPATGQIVAELVEDGEASLVDVSELSSDRFERGEALVERNVA
jgi:sarcosine oxidase subunit beta